MRIFLLPALVCGLTTIAMAHPGGHGPWRTTPATANSTMKNAQVENEAAMETRGELLLAQREARPRGGNARQAPPHADVFAPFVQLKAVQTRWDERFFYVESNGIPAHPMMIGITSWQQQVPLPQKYFGDNAWQIPLQPVPAETPASTRDRFLRGAIAIAANGIPIFNPLNNRGDDAFLFGELDEYGGHCGRADDYHYHIAPVHLEKTVGKGKPIAYALDGYPIYGYEEPDGSPVRNLDALNGHKDANGQYHYHATKTYPYLNGGFYGEVVERDGQVDPQPRAEPLRPSLPPMQGAKIVGFEETKPGSYKLTYDIRGKNGTVSYQLDPSGSATFEFVDPQGKKTSETYTPGRRGGGGDGRRPPRGGDNPPPPRPGDNPPPRRGGPRPEERDMPPERGPQGRPEEPPTAAVTPLNPAAAKLALSSSSINAEGKLSIDCTCDGKGESPAIAWKDAPAGTKSFAISLWHTAPDQEKSYWLVYNIPAPSTGLVQKSNGVGTVGLNDRRKAAFDPMCSKGPGEKTYHITVFALKDKVNIAPDQANRANLLPAIKNLVLAEGTLNFQYEREGAR